MTHALSATAPPSQTRGQSEFGDAGIDLTAAGIFTGSTCDSFGSVFAVSRSSSNSSQAQMKDVVGPGDFNIGNCGTVIIRKVTDPAGDAPTSLQLHHERDDSACHHDVSILAQGRREQHDHERYRRRRAVRHEGDPSPLDLLTNIDCSASSVSRANISTDTSTRTVLFSLGVGETLDCMFTNTKQTGALRIRKNRTKTGNPLVSNDGAVFSYDGTLVTDNGTGDEDADVGEVCVWGLATGDYTVNESIPPLGYLGASPTDQTVTVVAGTNCSDNPPAAAATATFTNPPLADIQVSSATAAQQRRRRSATSTAPTPREPSRPRRRPVGMSR